jgi:acetyl-CoA acetyltransferase
LSEVEMIGPVIRTALDQIGASISDIDFTCSGSSDYLAGQAFSFVMTLDAVGAWPPIAESHVEMDGAWALYEAWIKIQAGHAETALVYGYSKASPGDLPRVLSRMLDPYYYGPLWPDSVAVAGLQARAMLDAGMITEAEMAGIAHRNREAARANPHAQLCGSAPVDELLSAEHLSDPLRRHDCPPITDGGCAVVLASAERAREWAERPAFIRGIDHRIDSHNMGARDLTRAPSVAEAGRRAGVGDGKVDVAELCAPFTHQEKIVRTELGLGDDVVVNPSGGPLAANPIMAAGLIRLGEVANRIMAGEADRGVAHATSGHLLQQNLVAVLEGE